MKQPQKLGSIYSEWMRRIKAVQMLNNLQQDELDALFSVNNMRLTYSHQLPTINQN